MSILFALSSLLLLTLHSSSAQLPPAPSLAACYEPNGAIYCYGPLLQQVQMARIFNDSKTFVDMPTKFPPAQVYANFLQASANNTHQMSVVEVQQFLDDNFLPVNTEFEPYTPPDWTPNPTSLMQKIQNPVYKQFALNLNAIWKDLGRKISDNVRQSPDQYSLLYVADPFIVPGGRFREFYYWDSYWTMKGLLLSEMYTTVRGMLENFASIVYRYGHIPNGSRVYYLQRSQPPLFTLMVADYLNATNDTNTLRALMPACELEYQFWLRNRTVQMPNSAVTLARYNMPLGSPRPESYAEDVVTASTAAADRQALVYANLGSAAEAGWDFSYRWLSLSDRANNVSLANLDTVNTVPVDLNALLCGVERTLANFASLLNYSNSTYYQQQAAARRAAIVEFMWNETDATWYDYDLRLAQQRPGFYLSNYVPLYTQCGIPAGTSVEDSAAAVGRIRDSLINTYNVLKFPGGVPTSLMENTGQQWDYPNAWAPLQHMLIDGLRRSAAADDVQTQQLALQLAQIWVNNNYIGFNTTGYMFEKYNATVAGQFGNGGEYDVVKGFGWTNGVVLALLETYGDQLAPLPGPAQ